MSFGRDREPNLRKTAMNNLMIPKFTKAVKSEFSWSSDDDNPMSAEARSADEHRRQNDPRWKLNERLKQCSSSRTLDCRKAPDLDELNHSYGDAPKQDLFYVIRTCAKWISYGARLSISNSQDVEAAEALQKKWARMDGPQITEHMIFLVQARSIEDLRTMLADAFEDVEKRMGEATGEGEDGFPIVKSGSSVPSPGQEWY